MQVPAYVSERDIDLLLLEEFHVSPEFRAWFVANVYGTSVQCAQFVGAWHSVDKAGLGESDLILEFLDSEGDATAILIEDKIDALPQPEQGARYRLRGEEGLSDGSWRRFRTCIVAPQAYLTATADVSNYDSCISYQAIKCWFANSSVESARMAYKASIVQEGIDQNRRGYQRIPHAVVTRFWQDYWKIASTEYPHLQMENPGPVPARSDWAQFKADSGLWIKHKLDKGSVELAIPSAGDAIEQLMRLNSDLLVDGLEIVVVGKSAAFSLVVPRVNRLKDLSEQAEDVRTGLAAATRLKNLVAKIDLTGLSR